MQNEDSDNRCPKCRDCGWVRRFDEFGKEYLSKCDCGYLNREIAESRLRFATIPSEFKDNSVENFKTDCYSTQNNKILAERAKKMCLKYVKEFKNMQMIAKGLYLYSTEKGSGKTRMATSIANDIMKQHQISCKYATTIQILDEIKSTFNPDAEYSEMRLLNDIASTKVLIIDDIGVEKVTPWVDERLYTILNRRMIENKITIFTSNCKIEELQLDSRTIDRIKKMALPIQFPNESVRSMKAISENKKVTDYLLSD